MTKKKNSNNNKQVSSGYTSKRIPQGMIHVGTTSDGTKIYSASALIMKIYYPDLYKMRPNRTDYIFTGNNGVYTPISSSNDAYDKFIDRNLLRYNTLKSTLDSRTINDKNAKNNLAVSTLNTVPASAYDEKSPIVAPNIERYTYWDPVNVRARDIALSKDILNRMFLNNLLEGALLFGGPPLIALGLSNPATALPTIGGLAGYFAGAPIINNMWANYISPEHNTFDYDFGNAFVLPLRELIGDKNKASITDKNATIIGSLLNPMGWLSAKGGAYSGKLLNLPLHNAYNTVKYGINNFSLYLPDSLYLKYINVTRPLKGEVVYTRPTSGFMIKPLFECNKLEMQMGKDGDISVKAILNYMKTLSLSDLAIMLKALNTFDNLNKISYFAFKLAVLDQIPLFTRIPHNLYSTYGMSRLNLNMKPGEQLLVGGIRIKPKYKYNVKSETYAFEDLRHLYPYSMYEGRINAHYPGEPLGHSRTYTTVEDPNILHVMESLSDWALHLDLSNPKLFPKDHNGKYPIYEDNGNYFLDNFFVSLLLLNRNILLPNTKNYITGELFFDVSRYNPRALASAYPKIKDPILLHMADTYTLRHIYENMRKAFESGLTKMRYPTSDTAAKIEGYQKVYEESVTKQLSNLEKERELRLEEARMEQYDEPEGYMSQIERDTFDPLSLSDEQMREWDRRYALSKRHDAIVQQKRQDKYGSINNEINERRRQIYKANENKKTYLKEHLSILDKYERFPKQFKKLFPNQDVRIVTDNKGNTWYEVDIPKNFMDIEWLFAKGGTIHRLSKLTPKRNLYNI